MDLSKRRLLLAASLLAASSFGHAQADYPNQPIKIIVPSPAGGGADHTARILSAAMSANTGWTVIVDNKAGASGLIGTEFAARAKPDGYTLLMGQTATIALGDLISNGRFDPMKDFVSIAMMTTQPLVLVVPANSPYKTMADVVAAMKTKGLTMSSAGNSTVGHLVGEQFAQQMGGKITAIPYKGTAPAVQDLAGGQTEFMFSLPPAVQALVQGGKLRALAVTADKRLPTMPDVPTTAEAGFKGVVASEWKVLSAPAGTPATVVRRLHAEVQKVLSQPAHIGKMVGDGSLPMPGTQAEAQNFVRAEHKRWSAFTRAGATTK